MPTRQSLPAITATAPVAPWRRLGLGRRALAGLLLLTAVVLAYLPVWRAGYIWDDDKLLTANPCIVGPLGLKEIWTTVAADICPLTITTFWFEHWLWGLAPLPYHVVSMLLHAAGAVLLWRVLLRLQVPGAWLGAALWALHPVQVESVAWISEMKNTESGVFYLLAILCFLHWRWPGERMLVGNRVWLYTTMVLCAGLAMAAKSSAIVLPAVLCLLAWWTDGRWRWRNLIQTAPIFLFSLAAGALTLSTQSPSLGPVGDAPLARHWPERLAVIGDAFWFYLGKLAWPHPLIAVYPRWEADGTKWWSFVPLTGAVVLLIVLWWKRRAWTAAGFVAIAYFLVALSPVLGLVDISYFRHSFVADHFLYLASMGPMALAGAGIAWLFHYFNLRDSWLRMALTVGLVLLLGTLSWQRALTYQSQETLWTDTLAKNPRCWVGYASLGKLSQHNGRLDEAISRYQKALQVNPAAVESHNNLGILLFNKGRVDEAIRQYQETLAIDSGHVSAHSNLGNALLAKGQVAAAVLQYEEALKINPADIPTRNNLGNVFLWQGRIDDAISEYSQALAQDPHDAPALSSLGACYIQKGKLDAAVIQLLEALKIDPNDARTHSNLGLALLRKGHVKEAIPEYEAAAKLNPANAEFYNSLGTALAQSGRIDEAISQFQEAARINPNHLSARSNLALAYTQQGRFDDAIAQYQEALRIEPGNARTNYNLGKLLAQTGRLDDAILRYRESLKIEPNNASAHAKLGVVLMEKGQVAAAIDELQEALRLKPGDDEAETALTTAQSLAGKNSDNS
jgi:Flp pilus assembly protein TadD